MADLEEGIESARDEKWLVLKEEVAQLEMRNGWSGGRKWISWR
jgi:hypothetical protein